MQHLHQDDIFILDNHQFMTNFTSKLFTTFTSEENLEETIQSITKRYSILFNKIFILKVDSINSLNALIRELNCGVMDNKFIIPWEEYKNSILLVSDGVLKSYPTKIHKIITL